MQYRIVPRIIHERALTYITDTDNIKLQYNRYSTIQPYIFIQAPSMQYTEMLPPFTVILHREGDTEKSVRRGNTIPEDAFTALETV